MRRNGEFASEVFYFGVVKAGLSTKVRFCAILAVFLLLSVITENPRFGKAAWPEFVECARLGVGCWVGIVIETSMPPGRAFS